MIVLRDNEDGKTQVLGVFLNDFKGPIVGADEQVYLIKPALKDLDNHIVEGGLRSLDRVAFNVPWSEALENGSDADLYPADVWEQMMAWSKRMPTSITSSSGKRIAAFTANNALSKLINSCAE